MSKLIDKEAIKLKEQKLADAKVYLKKEFIGIDDIIDKFIDSIRIWYILPDIQSRPLIINLWGITGVGKTDLVRKFVKFIDFADKFVEIQMDSMEGHGYVEDYLENSFEEGSDHGILLLDEIQRFRTIGDDGAEMKSDKYQDIWMLLSDGTFQSNSKIKQQLISMILESDYYDERDERDELINKKNKKNKPNKPYKYNTSYWDASRLKKILKLNNSLQDIMFFTKEQKLSLIKEKLNNKDTYDGRKYSKLLIIISGNLDEAFKMANAVSDSDYDADIYHEFSKKININSIKKALQKRFKPEQIARFGNTHLIYPIPNKLAYQNIIKQKINIIVNNIKEKHNIDVIIDDSVCDVIYQNGVYPTQGVRPLISTISSIVENSLPTFLFEYLDQSLKDPIKITHIGDFLHSKIGKNEIKCLIPRVLDDIKNKQTIDDKTTISVHESGHAVAYSILFKTVPTQIITTTASDSEGGFIGIHDHSDSKQDMINTIIVLLSGRVAEELVFGENHITSGASGDYVKATKIVSRMVRVLGMSEFYGYYQTPLVNQGIAKADINKTDDTIELLLKELYLKTKELITKNKDFLIEIATILIQKGYIQLDDFKTIASKYVETINIINPKDAIEINFYEKFNEFKNNK